MGKSFLSDPKMGDKKLYELLYFPLLWPDSHMSHRDISSQHELIADEFSETLSLWLDSHMSHRDISSLHARISDAFSNFLLLWPDSHNEPQGYFFPS